MPKARETSARGTGCREADELRRSGNRPLASGVRLFSRFTLPASGTLRYRLTREVIPPTVTSNGVWFNVGIVWDHDPTTLPPGYPTGGVDTAAMWRARG